ncbi:MAG: replicative DNA helicase, partial [Halioglobus sp.]
IAEQGPKAGGPEDINPLLKQALGRIEELAASGGGITGLTTGFSKLDDMTSGLQPSDLVIVAGRPSMGKTSFAMNLVENAVLAQDKPVLVFSMEMPADSLIVRMLSSIGRIDQTRIRTGALEQEDWPRLSTAVNKLKDVPLFIDDTPALTPTEVRSRARRVHRENGGLAMIMVDYLQLMRVAGASEGRTAEISEISRSLKAIAKEFNCPMVALSQLNRSLEQRPNKRPVNSDLRESGAIEQDADVIMFIYRDEVYNEESPDKGIAEIIIGKQRNGPIGTAKLAFIGQNTRFENLAPGAYDDY